jgi:YD repeat-containing protein
MKTENKPKPLRLIQSPVAADVSSLHLATPRIRADSRRLLPFTGLSPGLFLAILTICLLAALLPVRCHGITFTKVTAGDLTADTVGGWNASWVDYDGDGYVDVSVAPGGGSVAKPNALYHNERDGTFRKVTTNAIGQIAVKSYGHVWGDYDNDGKPDLFVPNLVTRNDILFHNKGNGNFTQITTGPIVNDGAWSVLAAWADYDRDGYLVLFVTAGICPGQNDLLYRNNGDGTFQKMTEAEVGPLVTDLAHADGMVWADVDSDGWLELCRTMRMCDGGSWTNGIWHLDNEGKFYLMDISEMLQGTGDFTISTWADYDNDGFLDAVLSNGTGAIGFYRSLAGQAFTNIAASAFPGPLTNVTVWYHGDYDNDGWQDIVAWDNAGATPPALYRNNGDGTFTE